MGVAPALSAEVELFADLLVGLAFLDWGEGWGGEHPAADLVDALEVHLAERLVALPGFEVVDGADGGEGDFVDFPREEGRALAAAMLPDALGAVD